MLAGVVMAGRWRPVLEVADPGAALDWFATVPGMKVERARGEAVSGDLRIAVVAPGTRVVVTVGQEQACKSRP